MRYLASILLLACISASPGCMASLGSRKADQERAEDIGATVGAVASPIAAANPAVGAGIAVAADLAAREGARRAAATPEGEPLGLWTQILLGIGAFGGVFTAAKTASRVVVAKAVEAAATPPKT